MADTFTQIHIHIIFAVKQRENLIHPEYKEELHKYITGIVQRRNHKMMAIHAMPDHLHMLIGLRPSQSLSELVREIKIGSTQFINEKKWVKGKFSWQGGFGAFSHSLSQVDPVIRYIRNQEKHHERKAFKEEYIEVLEKFDLEYDLGHIFEFLD